ncbi:hypothetical protein TNCV_1489231 [Trichonephila clavipes]|nr:hypothetical protein TNCV_1489231 [Trichonephila clavipes]
MSPVVLCLNSILVSWVESSGIPTQLHLAVCQGANLAAYLNFFIVPCETYFTAIPSDLAKLLRPTLPEISSFKSEPRYLYNYYLEEEAVKGAFIQATVFAKPRLCNLANKTWEQQGAQTLTL